ncbi:MAG TPA: PrsW family intramembrane metalloprotease [Thermoplasmata archaeon]|nr:PrsW family intramembrane metalloprotease [Thermoplasmata archaeon]
MSSILKSDMGLIFTVIFGGLICIGGLYIFISALLNMLLFGVTDSSILLGVVSLFLLLLGTFILTVVLGEKGYYVVTETPIYKYQPPLTHYPQPNPYNRYIPAYGNVFTRPYRTIRFYTFIKYNLNIPKMKTLFSIFILSLASGFFVLWLKGPFLFFFPISFIIAFSFPSLMWISYVYHQEKKEPKPRDSIFKALLWGMFSTVPASFINGSASYFLEPAGFLILTSVIVAPLNEEFLKPLGIGFIKQDIKKRIDGLVFGVTCGMGFAMTENLLYEFSFVFSQDPASVWTFGSFVRGIGSTIIHAVGAGLIGFVYASYYLKKKLEEEELYQHKSNMKWMMNHQEESRIKSSTAGKLFTAYIVAVFLHSGWNGLVTLMVLTESAISSTLIGLLLFLYVGMMFLFLKYLVEVGGKIGFRA